MENEPSAIVTVTNKNQADTAVKSARSRTDTAEMKSSTSLADTELVSYRSRAAHAVIKSGPVVQSLTSQAEAISSITPESPTVRVIPEVISSITIAIPDVKPSKSRTDKLSTGSNRKVISYFDASEKQTSFRGKFFPI